MLVFVQTLQRSTFSRRVVKEVCGVYEYGSSVVLTAGILSPRWSGDANAGGCSTHLSIRCRLGRGSAAAVTSGAAGGVPSAATANSGGAS